MMSFFIKITLKIDLLSLLTSPLILDNCTQSFLLSELKEIISSILIEGVFN